MLIVEFGLLPDAVQSFNGRTERYSQHNYLRSQPTMGACHSRRDVIPADSIHVLLGIKDDKDLKWRYSQEDSCSCMYRSSSLDEYVNTLREEEEDVKHPRRAMKKRGTMETLQQTSFWSLGSENVDGQNESTPRSLAYMYKENSTCTQSCAALVEPTQTPSQCSLAA